MEEFIMKKYLLSGLFIFMFVLTSQIEVSQSQSRDRFRPLSIDGVCYKPVDEPRNSLNYTLEEATRELTTLCSSGSFSLIDFDKEQGILMYACSGAFGGASVICHKSGKNNQ